MKKLIALAIGIGIFIVAAEIKQPGAVIGPQQPKLTSPVGPPDPAKEAREKEFQRYVAAARGLRASMKNPASFELVKASRVKPGTLCLTYRATNSFNAVVPGQAVFAGEKAAMSDHGGNFVAMWNKHCAGKGGEDWTYIKLAML